MEAHCTCDPSKTNLFIIFYSSAMHAFISFVFLLNSFMASALHNFSRLSTCIGFIPLKEFEFECSVKQILVF